MFTLDGKVALVTGAGQNVGAGIARLLAAQGATVVVNDFHADRAQHTTQEITSAGGAARALRFDVSDANEVDAAVADIASREGAVDILVNCAGNGGPQGDLPMVPFGEATPDFWSRIFAVNLYGMMNCCKAVLSGMVERGQGRIITISSGAGQVGLNIGVSSYAAAKAGQNGFMRHLASEYARNGITANTIALGLVLADPSGVEELAASVPMGRVGTPEDPGHLAVYLASDEAGWITGQTIGMNGGATMI